MTRDEAIEKIVTGKKITNKYWVIAKYAHLVGKRILSDKGASVALPQEHDYEVYDEKE